MLLGAFLALGIVALPAISFAETYAYVHTSGEVRSVTANDPMTAIATAVGRAMHSGVILLNSQADTDLLGDNVSGF